VKTSYEIELLAPEAIVETDLTACIRLLKQGGAVDIITARRELPLSASIVVARHRDAIVAVAAIKRARSQYAAEVATKSKESFSPHWQELGYVAVAREHQGNKLSKSVVERLLEGRSDDLWATTSHPGMKKTLLNYGFVNRGEEWRNAKGESLSLWIREKKIDSTANREDKETGENSPLSLDGPGPVDS
jgi:predicted GNAT family N-acyltransferase